MLISFQKSDKPHCLINTNQIVECMFMVDCEHLHHELPSFVYVADGKKPLYKCIDNEGEQCFVHLYNWDGKIIDTPEGLFIGHFINKKGTEEFIRKYKVIESDVPDCMLKIYFSGTGASMEGSSAFSETFRFKGLEDFLTAIDAIKAHAGIQVVG